MDHEQIRRIDQKIGEQSQFIEDILKEIGKVIVGQRYLVERLLIGLLADGHILIEGVPGLAKTLAVSTLSRTIATGFQRIQFTPDMLPADILGTMIYNQKDGTFVVKQGPVFTNLLLADEINRAPAKVQSALLEAMQERQVTLGDRTYRLDEPFLVLATQNPIEQEGTYPLPEAQVDRFMLKLSIGYPTREEERRILDRMTSGECIQVDKVTDPDRILAARKLLHEVYMDDRVKDYIVNLVFASRYPENFGLAGMKDLIRYGASPRATIYLTMAAKAHAFIRRRGYVNAEDVKAVAMDVLRHRVIITYEAEAEDKTPESIVEEILNTVEVP
ncbi:AAA family ATPase [bacterium]|nr:AAA family ATPase [candidate division CSSED10-310 bacterium]